MERCPISSSDDTQVVVKFHPGRHARTQPQRLAFFLKKIKEFDPFFWMTHRLEPSFLEYDSKNWTLFQYDSQNWTCFSNTTQRIKPFFLWHDSKNWTFYWKRMTQWIGPFLNMTQRIEPSFKYERETLSVALAALSVILSKLRVPSDERSSSFIGRTLPLSCQVVVQ